MKLYIENIGKISKSEILLDGLTVLTGFNDNGKSTIGKSLFSFIKLLSPKYIVESDNFESKLFQVVSNWYDDLGYARFVDMELKQLPQTPEELTKLLVDNKEKKLSIYDWLNPVLKSSERLEPRLYSITKEALKLISEIYNFSNDNRYKDSFSKIWGLEFSGRVTTLGKDRSIVKFCTDNTKSDLMGYDYELFIKNDKCDKLSIKDKSSCLEDVTYVDSPLYMHLFHVLRDSKVKMTVPLHITDLTDKLNAQRYLSNSFDKVIDLSKVLGSQGFFKYQEDTNSLVFVRDSNSYPVVNVASGLKSFGVLQLLLNGGFISAKKMLIWDEPENHIHPEWQLNFAEIIVQLVKSGIPILLTTHSPYFLQSLRYYTRKYEMTHFTNFYFASADENALSSFVNVNYTINDVFFTLAEPLNRVMNIDLIEED